MNYTRGFLRLWAVLGVCWIVAMTLILKDDLWLLKPDGDWIDVRTKALVMVPNWSARIKAAVWTLLPPAMLLLLGFVMAWIARGFRSSAPPEG